MAVNYLFRAYGESDQSIPSEVVDKLTDVARNDKAFAPRLQARRALADLEMEVPADNHGGTYEFKVWHSLHASTEFVLELSSEHTLADLHDAIQSAWEWGSDHMYIFYMTGKKGDEHYEFSHEYVEDTNAYAYEITLGELGLRLRQKFLYLFDFGDNHEFTIVVHRINPENPETDRAKLPRIVDKKGEPMLQYPIYE